jgi:pectin methylesterase-like acyl-CoA thioesterase
MRAHALASIAAATLLCACSSSESSASDASKTAPSSTGTTASTSSEPLLSADDAVPSQEEADQAAEASINDQNADAELEKLEKELADGGG